MQCAKVVSADGVLIARKTNLRGMRRIHRRCASERPAAACTHTAQRHGPNVTSWRVRLAREFVCFVVDDAAPHVTAKSHKNKRTMIGAALMRVTHASRGSLSVFDAKSLFQLGRDRSKREIYLQSDQSIKRGRARQKRTRTLDLSKKCLQLRVVL